MEKTKGQVLVDKLTDWIGGYMYFTDPNVALVAALWAINTWVFKRFDAVPYLCVTAATKQAGKTRLMELLQMVSQNGRMFGAMTPAAMFRLLEAFDSNLTIYFDEAESLSSAAAGVMRTVMNTGYRRGQTIPRTLPGGKVAEFPVFSPKCFALIGDVNDTLRDRSIVLTVERGKPMRDFDRSSAEGEAKALVELIRHSFTVVPTAAPPSFLSGRDREIWAALFGVAEALKLDKVTMDALIRAAADLTAAKTAPARRYVEMAGSETEATDSAYAERALADLSGVLRDGEKSIFSATAVARMRELASGPWRTFRGVGLTEITLANLVSRFGVQTKNIRGGADGKSVVRKGYSVKDIKASLPREVR